MKHAVPLIVGIGVAAAVGCGGSGDGSSGDQSDEFQQPSLADQLRDFSDGFPVDDQAPPGDPEAPLSDEQAPRSDGDACILLCSRPDVALCEGDCLQACAEVRTEFGDGCLEEVDAWLLCLAERATFVCRGQEDLDETDVCRDEVRALVECRVQVTPDRPNDVTGPAPGTTAPAEPVPLPGADADGGVAR